MAGIKRRLGEIYTPSAELFAFQGTKFLEELTEAFSELASIPGVVPNDRFFDSPPARKVREVVRAHTGLIITFQEGICQAALPAIDRNSIFLEESERNYARYLEESGGYFDEDQNIFEEPIDLEADVRGMMQMLGKRILNGSVDLKAGRVDGVFSEMPCRVWHSRRCVYGRFGWTPAHNAAVLLHELGHIMTGLAVLGRQVTTNQHLAIIARTVDGSHDYGKRETIIAMIKDHYGLSRDQIDAIASAKNGKQACIILLDQAYRTIDSELGTSAYDEEGIETVADAYAVRCGAGKLIAEASSRRKEIFNAPKVLTTVNATAFLILGAYCALLGFPLVILSMFIAATVSCFRVNFNEDQESAKSRLTRIRNELTDILKDQSLEKSQQDCVIEDLRAVDAMLASIKIHPSLFQQITKFLGIKMKTKETFRQLQESLDSLANNRLFANAAQLRNL